MKNFAMYVLYKRDDVDLFLHKRERDKHPEIWEWYTVEDVMVEYEIDRKSVV